jgi:serine/threonine protein kinase
MSPEQARGKPVDKRTDIWAFGCVVYELLAGKQAFHGEDATEILAAVVKSEPDWTALPPASPVKLLRRCLEKDPKRRLRDIGDATLEPEKPQAEPSLTGRSAQRLSRHPLVWTLVLITASSLGFAIWNRPAAIEKSSAHLTISLPRDQEITSYPAISRDGRTVAYVTQQGNEDSQLYCAI